MQIRSSVLREPGNTCLYTKQLIYFRTAQPLPRGQHVARNAVFMLLAETSEMILTISLSKPRQNAETILKNCKLFIDRGIHYITGYFCINVLKQRQPSPVYFYCKWAIEKHTGKIMRIIICIHTHSSFWELNFMLPDHEPSLVEVARTRQKVDQAWSRGWKHD
jgi:hypothetical protein